MTNAEFKKAAAMALRGQGTTDNLDQFNGFGLPDFKKRLVGIEDVAGLLMWQCQQLDGGWDWDAANEVMAHGRTKFVVVDKDEN